ncbi:MAG: ABC transporter permease [Bryobacteraceae bacterium]|jgi:putative ABC transport system permease protein
MNAMGQDLRFGVRLLTKAPGFSAVALATLALGIGAATSIFSVVDAVVFKPLPFRDPDRVLVLWEKNPSLNRFRMAVAVGNFREWSQQAQMVEGIAGLFDARVNLTGGPNGRVDPEELKVERVSASMFPMLGVQPILGRAFQAEEDRPGHANFALLSHSLWERKFAADPLIQGKTIRLRDQPYTVVGVLPAGFGVLDPSVDVYVPLALNANDPHFAGARMLMVVARLKPGATLDQAKNEMETLGARLEQSNPAVNRGWRPNLFPIQDELFGNVQKAMWVLLGAVGLLLLMACANVANLLLAHGAARQKEIAIRAALGASRGRLMAQLLCESVLLALAGGALGLALARGSVALVARLGPASIPRLTQATVDGRLFLFAFAVSVLTGILFGMAPAIQGSRANLNAALTESGRGGTAGRAARRLRSALVVAEIALALLVLIGAGLLMRSFTGLRRVDPGFQPQGLLTLRIPMGGGRNNAIERRVAFFQQVIDRVAVLRGVRGVGAVSELPLAGLGFGSMFWIDGRPLPAVEQRPVAMTRGATAGYFRTIGIPLIAGRFFNDADTAASQPVAIVDQTLAKRFWPQGGAIGGRVITDANEKVEEIVGVVGKVKPDKLDGDDWPTIYMPHSQKHDQTMILVVRTAGEPMAAAPGVVRTVHDLDPEQPVADVRPMERVVESAVAGAQFNTVALAIFAAIAFMLAAIGIYGVISYDVTARTNEIGIRMALGAESGDVVKLIVGHGARLAAYGIAVGLVLAFGLTRLMASMLFGVSPRDFYTFAAISALLGAVALAASYLPARRAMALQPAAALRR